MKNKLYKVVEDGKFYSGFSRYVDENMPELSQYFLHGVDYNKAHLFYIVFEGQHPMWSSKILCIIQDIQTKQVFVIGKEGLEEETEN